MYKLQSALLGLWILFLPAAVAVVGVSGCAPAETASSETQPTNVAADSAETQPESETIVELTPVAAEQLASVLESSGGKVIYVGVDVAENCTGYMYALDVYNEFEGPNVILTKSRGVMLAIESEDAAFLKGTVLDFYPEAAGFKFETPNPDTSLLREYQEQAAANGS